MEDLENGLDENGLIDYIKIVLLSGINPRGEKAFENLKWGIKQYRKKLILNDVGASKWKLPDLTNDFHSIIQRLRPPRPEGKRNMGVELEAIEEAAKECQRWMKDHVDQGKVTCEDILKLNSVMSQVNVNSKTERIEIPVNQVIELTELDKGSDLLLFTLNSQFVGYIGKSDKQEFISEIREVSKLFEEKFNEITSSWAKSLHPLAGAHNKGTPPGAQKK